MGRLTIYPPDEGSKPSLSMVVPGTNEDIRKYVFDRAVRAYDQVRAERYVVTDADGNDEEFDTVSAASMVYLKLRLA